MRAFIAGGAGFIGSHLVHEFVNEGAEVCVYDALKNYNADEPAGGDLCHRVRLAGVLDSIQLVHGDTRNQACLRRIVEGFRPDVVIHLASLPVAKIASEQPEEALSSIVQSTFTLLEILRDRPRPCSFVYVSSSMVYGDFARVPVRETDPTDPKDVYGSLKLAGEILCRGYASRYGLDVRIVRPSAVYGPFQRNDNILRAFVRRAMRNEPIEVHGDGGLELDFTFVKDLAKGLYAAATVDAARGETFNLTRGRGRSISTLVSILRRRFPSLDVRHVPVPSYVPRRGALCIDKARRVLGFDPRTELEEGLEAYFEQLGHPSLSA